MSFQAPARDSQINPQHTHINTLFFQGERNTNIKRGWVPWREEANSRYTPGRWGQQSSPRGRRLYQGRPAAQLSLRGITAGFCRAWFSQQNTTEMQLSGIWRPGWRRSELFWRNRERLRDFAAYSNGSRKQMLIPSRFLLIHLFVISFTHSSMYSVHNHFLNIYFLPTLF